MYMRGSLPENTNSFQTTSLVFYANKKQFILFKNNIPYFEAADKPAKYPVLKAICRLKPPV